ncbi:hypothetical protein [Aeromicrobium sp. IC_218]|uniref:hypothetical protein n=1 Tax=Aeromicrobium sp. IC_218 TaxID=2545468 RepID=UPI001040A390|nr:hypothetical protein [Aeromicrobium sp. IC_218]TCI96844.1 hypothetical protein E0W78_13445 [Aeromicrobium sp. IC_218]
MSRFVGALAGLVALLVLLVAVPAQWVATHVSDADGFADLAGPLVAEPEVRTELSQVISEQVTARLALSPTLGPVVADVLARAATTVVDDPAFRTAWEDTLRRSHEATLGGADAAPDQGQSLRLAVDLAPLARYVVDKASGQLPVTVRAPETVVVPITSEQVGEQIDLLRSAPDYARVAWIVLVAAVVVRLALARRRGAALARLGVGALVAAGVLWLAVRAAGRLLQERGDAAEPLARAVQDALVARSTASFDDWLLVVAGAGLAAVVVGVVLRRKV